MTDCDNNVCLKNSEQNKIKNELYDSTFTIINKDSSLNINVNEKTKTVDKNTMFSSDSNNFLLISSPTTSQCTPLMLNLEMRGLGLLGAKRGASSPNISSSSCNDSGFLIKNENQSGSFYPLAKIQRDGKFFK